MSSRRPQRRDSADIGPAIAIVMRDQGCDVDAAARFLKDEAGRLSVTIAEVAASIVAADAAAGGAGEPRGTHGADPLGDD